MAALPVNFKDDILAESMGGKRRYNIIQNDDGTISLEDVTTYTQLGSNFGAAIANAIIQSIINLQNEQIETVDPMLATEEGFAADAAKTRKAIEEVSAKLNMRYNPETDVIQIYCKGQWNDWKTAYMEALYLYYLGNKMTDVTNGFVCTALGGIYSQTPTVVYNESDMSITYPVIKADTEGYVYGLFRTRNLIDITDVSTIHIKYKLSGTVTGVASVKIVVVNDSNQTQNSITLSASSDYIEATLDVSDLEGSLAVGFLFTGWTYSYQITTRTITVQEIWCD